MLKKKAGRPRTNNRVITKSPQNGLKEGWTRWTFILREEHLEKIKSISFYEGRNIKDIVDEAMSEYLKDKKNRPILRKAI